MATYGEMTVKELQTLCRQRGLDIVSKKKADLVNRLATADENFIDVVNSDIDQNNEVDEEVEFHVNDVVKTPPLMSTDGDSEAIRSLKLQLQIAEVNLKIAQSGNLLAGASSVLPILNLTSQLLKLVHRV